MSLSDIDKQIFDCIDNDDAEALMKLPIKAGMTIPKLHEKSSNRAYELHVVAAANNAYECFVALTQELFNIDHNISGPRPIVIAAKYGAIEVFSNIMNYYERNGLLANLFNLENPPVQDGKDKQQTLELHSKVLYQAANNAYLEIYQEFQNKGFDFRGFIRNHENEFQEIIALMVTNPFNNRNTILFLLDFIEHPFKNLEIRPYPPLISAILHHYDDYEVMSRLIDISDINSIYVEGKDTFQFACYMKNELAARILLGKPIDKILSLNGFYNLCSLCDPVAASIVFSKHSNQQTSHSNNLVASKNSAVLKQQFYAQSNGFFPVQMALRESDENKIIKFLNVLIENGYDYKSYSSLERPSIAHLLDAPFYRSKTKVIEYVSKLP